MLFYVVLKYYVFMFVSVSVSKKEKKEDSGAGTIWGWILGLTAANLDTHSLSNYIFPLYP